LCLKGSEAFKGKFRKAVHDQIGTGFHEGITRVCRRDGDAFHPAPLGGDDACDSVFKDEASFWRDA
jgi:hypothetical protein